MEIHPPPLIAAATAPLRTDEGWQEKPSTSGHKLSTKPLRAVTFRDSLHDKQLSKVQGRERESLLVPQTPGIALPSLPRHLPRGTASSSLQQLFQNTPERTTQQP